MGIRERIYSKRTVGRSIAIFALVWAVQMKYIWALHNLYDDLPGNYSVYVARLISMCGSLFFIWFFLPDGLKRFKVNLRGNRSGVFVGAMVAYFLTGYFEMRGQGLPISQIFDGGIFALFIGLDEEFFDRGFVFALLENWGVEIALFGSAVIFGAEHFSNYLYGEDSLNYVLGHMVAAAGFGYLMAAVLVATGSIWVPVLFHASSDFPWVLMDPKENTSIVTGNTDWKMILIGTATYVFMARLILSGREMYLLKRIKFPMSGRLNSVLRYLGLVE